MKLNIEIRPNAVETKSTHIRINIIKPLKEKGGDELEDNRNIIQIKALVSETNNITYCSSINKGIKETVIGFTDKGLLQLTMALNKYFERQIIKHDALCIETKYNKK